MTTPNSPEEDIILQLAQELSQSTTPSLNDPDTNDPITLRMAIREILGKTTNKYTLKQRPISPQTPDDLYGHVMSLRSEHLITQALVISLADHLGLEPTAIIQKAKGIYQQ